MQPNNDKIGLTVRLKPGQKETLKKLAKAAGQTLSEWVMGGFLKNAKKLYIVGVHGTSQCIRKQHRLNEPKRTAPKGECRNLNTSEN